GQISTYSTAENQHGNAVQKRFANTTGSMSDACRGHNRQTAHVRAQSAHGVGHKGTAAFMGDQNGDNGLRGIQLVVEFGVMDTGNAECIAYADLFKCVTCEPGAGLFHYYHSPENSSFLGAASGDEIGRASCRERAKASVG